jgi:hypothetical protein
MRRLVSLLLAATCAVVVSAPIASAQSAGASYASTTSSLRFSVPEGWQLSDAGPVSQPVIEAGLAVQPAEGRAASVIVSQLNADITGMPMDDYKSLLDQVSATKGLLVSSSVERVPAPASASGEWVGVLQHLSIQRDGVTYDHVNFVVPMADREYTIGVTGPTGTAVDDARAAGFIAATLVP